MKNKDFKLLIEGFNKFLLNEHIGHTAQCTKLFASIPTEFQHYINDTMNWYNGDAWIIETDHSGDLDSEADQMLLFQEVAKSCGCRVDELLVNFVDNFIDDVDYNNSSHSVRADDFLRSYSSSGSLCGSFNINGESLKGFYYQLGTSCGLENQFKSLMSERSLKGLIFVAPSCSGSTSISKSFKGALGGAWG